MGGENPREWLRCPCDHDWRLGPLTDKLMRHRPAVCVKCWEYWGSMPESMWCGKDLKTWHIEDYEQHKDEIEERFFRHG